MVQIVSFGPLGPVVWLFLLAGTVYAQPSPPNGVRLSFVRAENASDCLTASALERELKQRMEYDPFEGRVRQWIEGFVERQASFLEVQLFERNAEGKTLGTRRLREQAADCHKLDDAIVLAIALIIDPTAVLAPANTGTPAAVTVGPNDTAAPGAAATNAAAQSREGVAARLPPAASVVTALARAEPTAIQTSQIAHAVAVGLDAVVMHGVVPGFAPGVELTTRVVLNARRSVALRLSALHLPEKQETNVAGDFGYSLSAMEAGTCATVSARQAIGFGCAAFGLGAVHTVVHTPEPFKPDDRLWAAFRLEVGAELQVVGPVWFDVRLFDFVAPRRWAFRVVTNDSNRATTTAYKQSGWMPGVAAGLGLHFD